MKHSSRDSMPGKVGFFKGDLSRVGLRTEQIISESGTLRTKYFIATVLEVIHPMRQTEIVASMSDNKLLPPPLKALR